MASWDAGTDRQRRRETERKTRAQEVWRRAGTARSRELKATGSYPAAVGQPEPVGRELRPSEAARPLALHTNSYTFVFSRLSHHTHRTQLQRAYCEGLHGAPPAEPNAAFYTELDERLRLQHHTLAAVHDKSVEESIAAVAAGAAAAGDVSGVPDTVAMRKAVNGSLTDQMAFFTSCMARYCLPAPGSSSSCSCGAGCGCSCRTAHQALAAAAAAGRY
ncbi:hypothetical protein CHLRE_06g283250v5 [Chlamydomonas reinhardtii]|uniref:Uncharacterized protein n=1 Tax=Chlamydomonas reinhardtii TaxID=3055 RepID=A8J253_CHLRE|nr:uncharacterized protein CHLRE_06g283250v5 [Chlamydomonas reinhardtii]PNW82544.1 hypothetical protein CHLRE_06g283250v5 [Chlamydomonas reinhardtii]|eukprot:XP_001695458.1 predicted protein [Chlamydomonas reinhardtii]